MYCGKTIHTYHFFGTEKACLILFSMNFWKYPYKYANKIWVHEAQVEMPTYYFGVPGFNNLPLAPDSSSLLMQDPGGSHDGSSNWIPATQIRSAQIPTTAGIW